MIRDQQDQNAAIDTTEQPLSSTSEQTYSPETLPHPRSPMQRPAAPSRQSSRSLSITAGLGSNVSSPSLRPLSSGYSQHEEWLAGGTRDESAFYQAETQSLTRENQMLKMRIRELGKDIPNAYIITWRSIVN